MALEINLHLVHSDFQLAVELQLPEHGISAIFGPSGSGKTSLLRAIAGLEPRASGRILVNGEPWQETGLFLSTHARPLGFVFQEASLFAHLSVAANIDYGRKRSSTALNDQGLQHLIELLGIGPLLGRRPAHLSGGERQRVAIARALAPGPRLLLMDEPLSALDVQRKQEILPYLERLRCELKIPMLYVSHAPDEIARLADYLVVLDAGRVQAQGPIKAVLTDVGTPIRLGEDAGAIIEGEVLERDSDWQLSRIGCTGGDFWVRDEGHAIGQRVRLRVLARDVSIALEPGQARTSILNHLAVRVEAIGQDSHPALALVRLRLIQGDQHLVARLTRRSVAALGLVPGMAVQAQVKAVAVIG